MPLRGETYAEVCANFTWQIPERYNIGVDVCDKWAAREPDRTALIDLRGDGSRRAVSFAELRNRSNAYANVLADAGIGQGDRVGIFLSQQTETALAHIAIYKLGAIAVPLFKLFGPDALRHRLGNCRAAAVITDAAGASILNGLRSSLPSLKAVFACDGAAAGALDLAALSEEARISFTAVDTKADDPAVIIYTSGTTGSPKGALHAHRVLLGHLPGVEFSHDGFPQPGDRFWTPADWAWIGGLFDVLLPSLHHGIPVVAKRFLKFTGEAAFELMASEGVRNAFIPPTALKIMRGVPEARHRYDLKLRTVGTGGESMGSELLAWGRDVLGVSVAEFYGQTEANLLVSSSNRWAPSRLGRMGVPVPGHQVDVIREDGSSCNVGEDGDISVRTPDPVAFLGYWENEEATRAKYRNGWIVTGDRGVKDEPGYIQFLGRDDDIITSAGYRIGPGEIEDCLLTHPAVKMAAVVGKPDPDRTEIVIAFVVLQDTEAGDEAGDLKRQLQDHVKTKLAAHEYPREIMFVSDLPLTATGKIMRRELRAKLVSAVGAQ
jgi:acetyl-CoA synthetase